MASTYPLEVVQAERWVGERKSLEGDALKKEAEKQGWDDSVKSLVATPSVLTMMNSKLDWTQRLGDAVLAQQPDVMDAVQRLQNEGLREQQAANDQRAESRGQAGEQQAAHRHRASQLRHHLRAVLRSRRGLWGMAVSRVSAVLLVSGARICRQRRYRDRPRLRRGLCPRSLGNGWALVGRQHQLGQARHQHQPRCPRGTLAARCAAPPWSGLQQCERATEVCRHHRSPRRQSKAGFSRPRRPAGVEARRR